MVTLSALFLSTRPWSFPLTVCAIALGGSLAFVDSPRRFSWGLFALSLAGGLLVHAAANLINTYGDFVKGTDNSATADDRAIVDGLVSAPVVYRLILGCTASAVAVLMAVVYDITQRPQAEITQGGRTWTHPVLDLLLLCSAGMFLAYAYTAPPFYWKYKGLGDICMVLAYGPLLVAGGYYCQLSTLPSLPALWFSLAPGLLTDAVLHVNNTRDQQWDRQCGAFTLPMKLGPKWSGRYFIALYATCFTAAVAAAIRPTAFLPLPAGLPHKAAGEWSSAQLAFLLPLLLLPSAVDLFQRYYRAEFKDLCPRCGEFAGKFGALQSLGLIAWGMRGHFTAQQ